MRFLWFFILTFFLALGLRAQTPCDTLQQTYIPKDTLMCPYDTLSLKTFANCSFLWSDSTTNNYFIPKGTQKIWVEITKNNVACEDSVRRDTIDITTYGKPEKRLPKIDTFLCPNDSLLLDETQAKTVYLWDFPGKTAKDSTIAKQSYLWVYSDSLKTASFVYPYTVTMTLNCLNALLLDPDPLRYITRDTAKIFFYRPPVVNLGSDTTLCPGESGIVLNALEPSKYLADKYKFIWSNGSTSSSITVQDSGTYSVRVNDVCGDTARDTVHLIVYPEKWTTPAHLLADTSLCKNQTVILDASVDPEFAGIVTYKWLDDTTITAPIRVVTESNAYTVEITDTAKCQRKTTSNVTFEDCGSMLEMPNFFSPNGDGINDVLKVIKADKMTSFEITIHNRWGRKVYSYKGNPEEFAWDGKNGSADVPDGAYYWVAKFADMYGKKYTNNGSVTILR